ncbi:MAG: hypothetical protein JST01_22375 [Cyanobacteria bacterium SZAS TMP-1]|nr:hypothetical protein [Cyanobacteria bacterium SZAS TMP-1]
MPVVIAYALCLFSLLACGSPALAWGSMDVKLGKGEELHVKNGLFGTRKVAVKDRLGDQYENGQGLFGTSHKKVQILGNGVEVNQGLLGNKSISARTILGDKFETHKSFFGLGPRTTKVDLSGASSMAGQLFSSKIMPRGTSGLSGLGVDKAFPNRSADQVAAPAVAPNTSETGELTPTPQWVPMPPRAH